MYRQLGIWEGFEAIGKNHIRMSLYTENLEPVLTYEFENIEDTRVLFSLHTNAYGISWVTYLLYFLMFSLNYETYAVSRPELYDLLWSQVPRERIHLGKKILSSKQNTKDVVIRCSDKTKDNGKPKVIHKRSLHKTLEIH